MIRNVILLSLLTLTLIATGCPSSSSTKEKELELKEKEIALKEKELEMSNTDKDKDDKDEETTTEEKNTETETVKESKKEKPTNDGKVYTPKKGSAERRSIFNALRVPVEKELKQDIVFAPDHFKVFGDWAFVKGEPKTKSGKKPDLKGTKYEEDSDLFDNNFFALLEQDGGKWKVVKYALGCTDVCYLGWDEQYNAPKKIFP